MRIGKISVIVIGLVPFNVYAECTPTPDCASIGYTETSCEGDYLACPFDSTKLKCIPCDSSYRYDCSGDDFTGGTGSACGGKYVSCSCSDSESTFKNGECVGPKCPVGYIYYSDKSCSAELDDTKTPIGVVVKSDTLIVRKPSQMGTEWGGNGIDIIDLPNYGNNHKSDLNGRNNSAIIVVAHTSENLTSSYSAAIYCNSYSTVGTNAGDWYLPAAGEIYNYMYDNDSNLKIDTTATKLGWISYNRCYCSSTEDSQYYFWMVCTSNGYTYYQEKRIGCVSPCFLAIN